MGVMMFTNEANRAGAAVDTLDRPAERCVSGYMPSDAENVVSAHLLVRRTYTLAARGMELQQRDRIAMMLNKHRVAMEQWHGQPDPALEEPPAASWQRHGAEPIIVDAALCSLREAAAETGQTSSANHSDVWIHAYNERHGNCTSIFAQVRSKSLTF